MKIQLRSSKEDMFIIFGQCLKNDLKQKRYTTRPWPTSAAAVLLLDRTHGSLGSGTAAKHRVCMSAHSAENRFYRLVWIGTKKCFAVVDVDF